MFGRIGILRQLSGSVRTMRSDELNSGVHGQRERDRSSPWSRLDGNWRLNCRVCGVCIWDWRDDYNVGVVALHKVCQQIEEAHVRQKWDYNKERG